MGKLDRWEKQFVEHFNVAQYSSTSGGRVFYLDSVLGGDANNWSGRRFSASFPTIASAYGACTASKGDVIVVSPYHTETITAVQTMNKIGVQVIGLRSGNQRPVFTVNGAIDLFDFTAAGQRLSNLELTIVTTDAATALINVEAAKCRVDNVKMIPSATSVNVVDCITMSTGSDDFLLENLEIYNTVVPVNSFINIDKACARFNMRNCYAYGDCATAGIIDANTATFLNWKNNTFGTIGTTIPVVTLDSNPTGTVDGFTALGTHTTIATNTNWGNALRLSNLRVLEETDASVQATNIIPALDTE